MSISGRTSGRPSAQRENGGVEGIEVFVGELIDELEQAYKDLMFEANRDERLLNGLAKRERDIDALKSENARLKREVARLKTAGGPASSEAEQLRTELERLKRTKGYRLQQKFWKLRKSLLER